MPYTKKQQRLFQAAAHNPAIAKGAGIPKATAAKLASEASRLPTKPPVRKTK